MCTFALQPTKQRENANWSRIGQLTRSGQVGFGFAKVRVILGHFLAVSENSEPRGAGPAASEAVWTAERTNVFNKLYLQTDSRLLPRRRRGRTRTPRGTRCRSVARSHLIPVYRPPHLIVQCNSRRRAASPFPSITKILSVDGRAPLRACMPERRQAHLHAIDASPFSRLEQLDANRTPSPYRKANGLVLKRLKVDESRERGDRRPQRGQRHRVIGRS